MHYSNLSKACLKMDSRHSAPSPVRWGVAKALGLIALLTVGLSHAAFPEKAIHMVVPFVPGGAADSAVRLMAPSLQKRLGQPVLIENKGGAGATIGTAYVATSPADGYTLLMGSASNAIGNAIQNKVPYIFERDFTPVMLVADVPGVVVVPAKFPVKNMQELIAYAKAHEGQLNYGSPGYGTSVHLAGELFQSMTGTTMMHASYKGASPAITDLLGMRLQLMFPALAAVQAHIQAGTLRALAVTTRKRTALAPDLPTVSESGLPDFEVGGWIGIFAPKGLPPDVLQTLTRAIDETMKEDELRRSLFKIGIEAMPGSAQALRERVESDSWRWEKVIKNRKMELQ
jgi:tripartite-type tricarboxylate transporter receptor subunit TctC